MRRGFFLIALLCLASVPSAPAAAQATRVTIAPLVGRGAGPARRAIRRALERLGYTVSLAESDPGDDVAATAQLAEAQDAEAVIGGTASGRGERWRFGLWVRDRLGGTQDTVSMRVTGSRGIRRLSARLHDALQGVPTAHSPRADTASGDAAAVDAAAGDTAAVHTAEPEARTSRPEDTPAAPAGHASGSGTPQTGAASPDTEPSPFRALVLIGAGVRSRRVEILSPDGLDAGYRAEPYFEVTARAEARFFDVAFVRARFGSSVALESDREDPSLQPVDTLFTWLRADAGASVVVDDTVELGAAFGVGWDRYELTFNELLPTVEYVHLRPAALLGVHLAGRHLVLDTEVGLRFPLGVGDLGALHGVEHSVFGVDGAMRLHGRLDVGFAWSAEVGVRQYWLTFQRPDGEVRGADGGWHATGYAGWEF